ncbi:MAG: hypothetical protein KAJ29_07150 [Alphaproteobacteria bacterium]|nr:hypothetical protein [Alphaproteobacteria bacterium]
MLDGQTIRKILLETLEEISNSNTPLQTSHLLLEAVKKIKSTGEEWDSESLLTLFYDMFRNGHLAWGLNLANSEPPFFHITEQGRNTLKHMSRDPANPDGYLEHLQTLCTLNPIAESYIDEALSTYNSNCFKASAVMVGAASESLILELRDDLVNKIQSLGNTPPKKLSDWRIKQVLNTIKSELEAKKGRMPKPISEMFDMYWPAFTGQIRTLRNDAGHPSSIAPITYEAVHASLLIFPELAKLAEELRAWIVNHYV